jgi:hypothetical protein
MLKTLFLVIVGVLVILTVGGFLLPSEYKVERDIVIAAAPEEIHGAVADLSTWPKWTAWTERRDPSCKWDFSGPSAGAGAVMTWRGEKMGDGRLELTEASPTEGIEYDVVFAAGQEPAQGGVRYEPLDDGTTRVTWFNSGELGANPLARYMGLLMDRMLGPDFEQGLAGLKERVEESE